MTTYLPGGQIPRDYPDCRCGHPAGHHSANQCWTNPDGSESQENEDFCNCGGYEQEQR